MKFYLDSSNFGQENLREIGFLDSPRIFDPEKKGGGGGGTFCLCLKHLCCC